MKSRAAILHDVGGPWSVEEFELDPPKAGEVLVKMAAAGLCHSDDHILKGDMSAPNEVMKSMGLPSMFPMIGGHEGSGIVQEVGPGVTDYAPGDHVVMSFVAACGQCRWCATGAEYICDAGIGTMIPGMPTDGTFRHHTSDGGDLGHLAKVGTFAEHTVASTNSLVKIEQHLPLAPSALLSCAIPTGYGSVSNRSNMRAGDTVVVIGVGGIGTAAIQSARINGAAQIVAVDPVEFKQKSALRFGATHTAGSAEEAMDLVRGLTYGVMADAVVVSPSLMSREDVRDGVAMTRKGGTCVLTGMTSQLTQSVKINLQDFILMNKTLAGTIFGSCNMKSDIARLATLYQSGQLMLDEMITRRYRLDDINDAYADLLNGEIIRGIIDFESNSLRSPALVLVHGGEHSADCWDLTVDELRRMAPELPVLAVDMPGHGATPGDLTTVGIADCVRSAVAQVESAGFGEMIVVGHSLAGLTVPGMVARLGSSRVREMILAAACLPVQGSAIVDTLVGPLAWFVRRAVRLRRPPATTPDAMTALLFCNGMSRSQRRFALSRIHPEAVTLIAEAVDRSDMPDDVPRTWILTLRDHALFRRTQLRSIAALGGVQTLIPVDTCHDLMISEPRLLAEILLERCRLYG